MALSGNLHDFSIPDVFRLVSLSGKTGVLHLLSEGADGSVWFRDGQVFFAQSDRRKGLLGERLVAAGRVSARALERAVRLRAEEPEGGRRIGEILVDEGVVGLSVLEAFVQEQIQDTVFDLFLWEEGTFEFELLEAPPANQDIGLAVSIENIVMEGARRLAEWTQLRSSATSGDVVFRVGSVSGEEVVDITLKPSEWRVVTLADGSRTVRQIAEAAGIPEFAAARTLYGLFGAGLLQIVEQPTGPAGMPGAPLDDESEGPLFLESEVILAQESYFEPLGETEPDIEFELGSVPAAAPEPEAAPAPAAVEPEAAPEPAPTPTPAPEPEPEPAPAGAYALAPEEQSASEGPAGGAQSPLTATRGAWAGIGNEVAALTGAASRRAKYAPPPARPQLADMGIPRRIRRDLTLTREELELIHAGIKAL